MSNVKILHYHLHYYNYEPKMTLVSKKLVLGPISFALYMCNGSIMTNTPERYLIGI